MRWESLFDDLESQLERELIADDLGLEAEEERLRLAQLGLRDRLVALGDRPLALTLLEGERHLARLADVGRDWIAADVAGPPAWAGIIPFHALGSVGLGQGDVRPSLVAVGPRPLADRLGMSAVLRDLCRRRRYVRVDLASGSLAGTIDRVGQDHLDLAVHSADTPRRESTVSEVRIIPLAHLRVVRPRDLR